MAQTNKNKKEFSKVLLIQESALIWIATLALIALAFFCVSLGFIGDLPWIAAMIGFPWAAYGVSQVWYYKKSTIENKEGGIKYESVLKELDEASKKYWSQVSNPIIENTEASINVDNSTTINNYEIDPFGPI